MSFKENVIDSTNITILAYVVMLLVFTIGFVWGKLKAKSRIENG